MTESELRARYPNASASFIRANADDLKPAPVAPGLRDPEPQHAPSHEPLAADKGKAAGQGRARVRIIRRATRLLDPDNLAGAKLAIDQLRYAGCIAEDSPDAIELELCQVKVATRKECGTEILIERLP